MRPDAREPCHDALDDRLHHALFGGLQLSVAHRGPVAQHSRGGDRDAPLRDDSDPPSEEGFAADLPGGLPPLARDALLRRHRQGGHPLAQRGDPHPTLRNHEARRSAHAGLVLPRARRARRLVGPHRGLPLPRRAGRIHSQAARPRPASTGRSSRSASRACSCRFPSSGISSTTTSASAF